MNQFADSISLDTDAGAGPTPPDVAALTTEQLLDLGNMLDDEIETRTAEAIAPLKERLDEIKDALRARALAAGETLASTAGRVEFVKPAERPSWDDRGLIRFAADIAEAHPQLFQRLLALRTVTPVEASARVRFAPKGKG